MTLDAFIEELKQRIVRCDGDEPMAVLHEVEDRDAWLGQNSERIVAMAKALKAADEVAAHYDALMLAEDEPRPSSVREYRRLRAEVEL